MTELMKLKPTVVEKIWGGKKLAQMKNFTQRDGYDLSHIGETWEVSLLEEGPSYDQDSGIKIADLIGDNQFQYLVKFIDASDDLSIQVHPGDEYAKLHENSLGKTECWFILDADIGCGIYLGLKSGVNQSRLEQAISQGENVSELLNFVPVQKGDFFFVPAGTIHAIGKGVTLAEVQQSSGVTYRVWDWNRVDDNGNPRELHVKKALDVINFKEEGNRLECFKLEGEMKSKSLKTLIEHRDFNVDLFELEKGSTLEISRSKEHRPSTLLNLDSSFILNGRVTNPYETIFMQGNSQLNIEADDKESLSKSVSFLYIY